MSAILTALLGEHWKTSLFGLAGAFVYYFSVIGPSWPSTLQQWVHTLAAAGVYAWGRVQSDQQKKT